MENEQVKQGYVGSFDTKHCLVIGGAKTVAKVKILGGAITISIPDDIEYEIPTEEQRENLKKVFGIDIEVMEDGK